MAGDGGVSDRIRREIDARGMSIRALQKAVAAATDSARGTSYPSIHALVNGEVDEPRKEVLEGIADVLGVFPSWLIEGAGPKDETEERQLARDNGENPAAENWKRLALQGELIFFDDSTFELFSDLPLFARRLLTDLGLAVYRHRGPRAFGVPYEGEWSGALGKPLEKQEDYGVLITKQDWKEYVEARLGQLLEDPPRGTRGEVTAAWLAALASVFLQELGSTALRGEED